MPAGVQARWTVRRAQAQADHRRAPSPDRGAACPASSRDRPTSCVRQADQRQRRVGATVGVTVHGAVDPQMIPPAAAGVKAAGLERSTDHVSRTVEGRIRRAALAAVPPLGSTSPSSIRSVVILPAPLGPRNAVTSPGPAEKESASTARTSPNDLESPLDLDAVPAGHQPRSDVVEGSGSALAGRPSSACRSGVSRMALLCTPARFGRICAKPPAGVSLPTRHGSSPRSSSNCSAFHSPTPKPCAASPSLRWSTRSEYRRRLRPLPRSIDAQASGAAATGRTRSLA